MVRSRCMLMMGLFIVSKLLLVTLLLQLRDGNAEWKTHKTPKPDTSVHFGEFCLDVTDDSDDSQWTSSTSAPSHPTMSAHPTQLPTQPTSTYEESTQLPEQTDKPDLEDVYWGDSPEKVNTCHCNEENMKDPAETSSVKRVIINWPTVRCNSREIIETLEGGRMVCVSPRSISEYIVNVLRPLVTTTAPPEPTTVLPTTTQPPVPETTPTVHQKNHSCESCNVITDLDNVDSKDIQFLDVKMQSFECSLLFYLHSNVNLSDGNVLCLDQDQQGFRKVLKKLKKRFYQTPENITDGCRCKDRNMKPPEKASPGTSTRVWAPTERCNTTEFIQTQVNGSEVCVTALSLSEYIKVPRIIIQVLPDKMAASRRSVQISPIFEPVSLPCFHCTSYQIWNTDPKDVLSVEMNVKSFTCPVVIFVRLKNGDSFCVTSDEPSFMVLLEML